MVVFKITNDTTNSELFSFVAFVVICNDAVANDDIAYF